METLYVVSRGQTQFISNHKKVRYVTHTNNFKIVTAFSIKMYTQIFLNDHYQKDCLKKLIYQQLRLLARDTKQLKKGDLTNILIQIGMGDYEDQFYKYYIREY